MLKPGFEISESLTDDPNEGVSTSRGVWKSTRKRRLQEMWGFRNHFFCYSKSWVAKKNDGNKIRLLNQSTPNLQEYHANILARIYIFLSTHCKSHNPRVTLDASKDPKNDTTLMGTCFSRLWWGDLVVKGERVVEDFV